MIFPRKAPRNAPIPQPVEGIFKKRQPINRISAIGQYIGQTRSVSQLSVLNRNVPKIANAWVA